MNRKWRTGILVLGALLLLGAATHQAAAGTIWLVRHAEKAGGDGKNPGLTPAEKAGGGGKDPGLTPAGKARAAALARMHEDAGIRQVYSTDFVRTRETAVPLAESAGVEVTLYDPSSPGELAERLKKQMAGTEAACLVVGHSNTIPDLVRRLGGDPAGEIGGDEYDRLYQVVILPDGSVVSTLLHMP